MQGQVVTYDTRGVQGMRWIFGIRRKGVGQTEQRTTAHILAPKGELGTTLCGRWPEWPSRRAASPLDPDRLCKRCQAKKAKLDESE